tara:strand:- start:919 stop:1143 length:225 start_codon:yes stop_codon:yes gene_type:complete
MGQNLIEYIRTELITASKKIDSILDVDDLSKPLSRFTHDDWSQQIGRISLLSQMITDFELSDEIDEEAILCGHY